MNEVAGLQKKKEVVSVCRMKLRVKINGRVAVVMLPSKPKRVLKLVSLLTLR